MRRYPFKQIYNMRDLGGYPTQGGGVTQFGRFIRSDAPAALAAGELDTLLSMGVTTSVDLRSEAEVLMTPSAFAKAKGIEYFGFSLDSGVAWPSREEDIPQCYLELAGAPAMAYVMRVLAAARGGVVFNCSAGKDRTGVTAALLLMLCGVAAADIIADYEVSYTYLRDKLRAMQKNHPTIFAYVGQSKPEYMAGFLDGIRQQYGGAAELLRCLKISEEEIARLRAKLAQA